MMRVQANAIIASPTTTPEAKALAMQIFEIATKLGEALKERIGP